MYKTFFSIITVTKNSSFTILETMKSVQSQTFDDYEHIVIDGASTDNTYSLIKNYKSEKIFSKQIPDTSCYEGINNAFNYINGRFVLFLHSGDLFYSEKVLENIKSILNKNLNIDLVFGNCIFFKDNKITRIWKIKLKEISENNCYQIPHTSTVINSRLIREIGNYKLCYKISSDLDYLIRIFKKRKISYLKYNDFFCKMKIGGLSTNYKHFFKKFLEDFKILLSHFTICQSITIYLKKISFKITQIQMKNKENQ